MDEIQGHITQLLAEGGHFDKCVVDGDDLLFVFQGTGEVYIVRATGAEAGA